MEKEPPPQETIRSFVDSTPLLGNGEALRERAAVDGYLFFKQLLPKEEIMDVRRDLLKVVEDHGWRQKGQDPWGAAIDVEAINRVPADEMRLDIGISAAAYRDAQRIESVHRIPHHKNLIGLYSALFDSGVLVHPRHIIRMITPHQSMVPTPQHQDFPLVQGTTETWTAWFPLGDCPREMGGLSVLGGSHKFGYFPIQRVEGAGGLAVQLCENEGVEWLGTDYEAGDVLTFSSLTVHRALRCQVKDQIRLSMDVRYQSADDIVEERSLKPHCHLDWEEIYASWKNDDLKYYWQRSPQRISPWDDSLIQPKRRIC